MTRPIRRFAAPLALVVVVGAAFSRAMTPTDLAIAIAAGALAGWVAAFASHAVGTMTPAPARTRAAMAGVVATGSFAVAVGVSAGGFSPAAVSDAIMTFFVVALPARGLDHLAVVAVLVLFPVALGTTWASLRQHTLVTVALPVLGLTAAGLLVAPVGVPWWVPIVLAAVAASVIAVDARNEISDLPNLLPETSDTTKRPAMMRTVGQLGPALLVALGVSTLTPIPATYDVREHVDAPTVRVDDLSPLAVAARWSILEDPLDAVRVEIDGATPGRLRLAVLDEYRSTGWNQAAEFAITGDMLVADPLFVDLEYADVHPTSVEVTFAEGLRGFRAAPTAGVAMGLDEPRGVRYAPRPGVLLPPDDATSLRYRSVPAPLAPPATATPPVAGSPQHLVSCPESETLRDVATQLTADTSVAAERLERIESWLLTRRIYDPEAPGGQTLGAIERFVDQPFASGNLEVFVSSYALLARCADVPTRVVVGFAAPAEGATTYTQADIKVWIETPLAGIGWVPLDPIPTPEEQELLAQLAQQPPAPPDDEPDETPPPVEVDPTAFPESSDNTTTLIVAGAATLVVLAAVAIGWVRGVPRLVVRRRRRVADPTQAVAAAWATVCDALVDRSLSLDGSHTPREVSRLISGQVSPAVQWLVADLGTHVDRARYSGEGATPTDAGQAWAYVDAIVERLPRARLRKAVAPTASRFRSTIRVPRRRGAWSEPLPDTVVLGEDAAPADLPDVEIQARIGDGSTGTVFRGTHLPTSTPVAVKVFRFGPGDPGFDQQRFDWEVRVAQGVTGLPHLLAVVAAGITPVTQRPYLVSTLHDDGTLLDRIRRGGPMTTAEAIDFGGDMSMALEALHQLGVIHGDVKPENVFASPDGWVLGDLGSAWLRASKGPAATLTPPYAAPEVWRGASPSPSADLYSLALTMLFACTGNVPVAGNPPPLHEIETAFPDHPVMARALDPNARRRPRGVADFARSLRPELVPTAVGRTRTLNLPTPTVSHSRNLP